MATNENKGRDDLSKLRRQAEIIARSKKTQSPDDLKSLSSGEFQQALHELQVHQIQLEMQNEELRKAQAELEIVKERYFDLYNLAPVGYITTSEKGQILEANLTAATLLGGVRETLIKQPLSKFILKENQDIFYHCRERLLRTEKPQGCELRMVRRGISEFWVSLEITLETDPEGLPVFRIAMSDITARRRADEALLENRQQLQNIIEFLPTATLAINKEGRVIIWNKAIEDMTGIPAAEMIGKGDHAYMIPFHGEACRGLMDFIFEEHEEIPSRYCHVTRNGDTIIAEAFSSALYANKGAWIFAKAAPLRDLDGNIIGAIESIRDISERKLVESYGETNRKILQILNEPGSMQDSVRRVLGVVKTRTGLDAVGIRLQEGDDFPYLAQEGFADDFLLKENSLLTRTAEGVVCRDEDGNLRLEGTCGLVISGKTDPSSEYFTPGGSFWTNDSLSLLNSPFSEDPRYHPRNHSIHQGYSSVALIPIRNLDKPVGLIQLNDSRKNCFTLSMIERLEGIASHIGGALMRKQAEDALRESEDRYSATLSVLETGLWDWHIPDGQATFSAVYYRILGYDNGEFLFSCDSWRNLVHPDDIAMVDQHLKWCFESGTGFALDLRMKMKSGEWRWVSKHGKVIEKDAEGRALRVVGTLTDITERKLADEERKSMQAQLHQAQKMEAIGTLAGGIAHDFNNILAAIIGYAEMVSDDCPAKSVLANNIDEVLKAGYRATALVKQILTFSRLDKTERIPLQPSIIIKEACKLLRASLPSTIDIQLDIDAESDFILADPIQIHQILMNLCTNAFHAMEDTGGNLRISLKKEVPNREDFANNPHLQPGDFIRLSVSDTGSGIATDILKRIFEPYFTTKGIGKGTGMGLAIAYGIVQSYGGIISCRSELGEGTDFHVYLPLIPNEDLSELLHTDRIQFGNEHILFIDDEKVLADMSRKMLERLGYRVTTRTNSIEALSTFRNGPEQFDLVITDQTMPDMTGSDLARYLLQIRPEIPIILCTGYSSLITEAKARSIGIKGFAMKPLVRKNIAVLIRNVLDT